MNPILEAAARAIYEAEYKYYSISTDWGALLATARSIYHEQAAAALRAMMEVPVTDGMCVAWHLANGELDKYSSHEACGQTWRALLGAVIEGE